jgi:hypothetical protein
MRALASGASNQTLREQLQIQLRAAVIARPPC